MQDHVVNWDSRWDYKHLLRTAQRMTRRRLRARMASVDSARADDLACEAVCRAIEKYDPGKDKNGKGPILLVRWKVAEVLREAAESEEEIVMDPSKLEGLMG